VEKIGGPFDTEKPCAKVGLVGDWKEEDTPSDLVASRLREAARLFENLIGNHSATDKTRIPKKP